MVRTIEEATQVVDEIVGRCVRDSEYGEHVLNDPETALAEYEPCEDILDYFRALAEHRDDVLAAWQRLRTIVYDT